MLYSTALAQTVLVITAAVLFYAAWVDLRYYKIRNELIIVLIALFLLHAVLSGHLPEIHYNILVALAIFLLSVIFYIRKGVGGGDVKLLTVGFLWAGYAGMLPFALFLLGFAVLQFAAVKIGLMPTRDGKGRAIPFAPTVASALICTFMLGYIGGTPVRYIPKNLPLGNQFRMDSGGAAVPQSR